MSDVWARPEPYSASLAPASAPTTPGRTAFVVPQPIRQNTALRAWGLVVTVVQALIVVLNCSSLVWLVTVLNSASLWTLRPESFDLAQLQDVLRSGLLYIVAVIAVALLHSVSLLVWVSLARRDPHLNQKLVRGSMVGTVVGLCIPIYSIVVFARTLTDLWQGSDPGRAGHGPRTASRATPPIVVGCCALTYFPYLLVLGAVARVGQALGTNDAVRDAVLVAMVSTSISVGASVSLVVIVTRVTDRLRGRTPEADDVPARSLFAQYVRT